MLLQPIPQKISTLQAAADDIRRDKLAELAERVVEYSRSTRVETVTGKSLTTLHSSALSRLEDLIEDGIRQGAAPEHLSLHYPLPPLRYLAPAGVTVGFPAGVPASAPFPILLSTQPALPTKVTSLSRLLVSSYLEWRCPRLQTISLVNGNLAGRELVAASGTRQQEFCLF